MKTTPRNLAIAFTLIANHTQAAVIASYDFDLATVSGASLDVDDSSQAGWTTTDLTDQATGIGALSSSNQAGANRAISTFGSTGNLLTFSAAREADAQTPLAAGGDNESTWSSFTVTPNAGTTFDFAGNSATVDTYANHSSGLGGTVSATWTLYYRVNGGSSWTSLGTFSGAATTGQNQNIGPVNLTWDLSSIGTQSSAISFLLDPVSTGAINGNFSQRGVGLDNLIVNADVTIIPEPSVAFLSLFALGAFCRRKR